MVCTGSKGTAAAVITSSIAITPREKSWDREAEELNAAAMAASAQEAAAIGRLYAYRAEVRPAAYVAPPSPQRRRAMGHGISPVSAITPAMPSAAAVTGMPRCASDSSSCRKPSSGSVNSARTQSRAAAICTGLLYRAGGGLRYPRGFPQVAQQNVHIFPRRAVIKDATPQRELPAD